MKNNRKTALIGLIALFVAGGGITALASSNKANHHSSNHFIKSNKLNTNPEKLITALQSDVVKGHRKNKNQPYNTRLLEKEINQLQKQIITNATYVSKNHHSEKVHKERTRHTKVTPMILSNSITSSSSTDKKTAHKTHKSIGATHNMRIWNPGIPRELQSTTGWISNIQRTKYHNKKMRYVRYTTPLGFIRGFNARPHYFSSLHSKLRNSTQSGRTDGVINSDRNPYSRVIGKHKYAIISSNNNNNSLYRDLYMINHQTSHKYSKPNYITVLANKHSIKIWNHHKLLGVFHRMTNKEAKELGY